MGRDRHRAGNERASVRKRRLLWWRLGAALLASFLFHLAWWFFLPQAPKKEKPKPAEHVKVEMVEVPPSVAQAPPAPVPPPPPRAVSRRGTRPSPAPPSRAQELTPEPKPPSPESRAQQPTGPEPSEPRDSGQGTAQSEPGGRGEDGSSAGPVDLFSKGALERSVQGWSAQRPGRGKTGSGGIGSGRPSNSPEDEARRVGGRVDGWLAQAQAAGDGYGDGPGGGCDDGIDNDFDGHIDCSDAGCRQLPICHYTGVYIDTQVEEIPDGDGRVLVRELLAKQEGRIRKLTVRVRLRHGDTRQVNVTLVAPSGEKVALHRANDSDTGYVTAYYVREFIGLSAAGKWTLEVEDTIEGVVGRLLEWGMYITS